MNTASTGLGAGAFPRTQWSTILGAGGADTPERRRSREDLARIYWRPVYAYLRRRWGLAVEEAADLAQEFFLTLQEGDFLSRVSPERGLFRSYVKASLDNFVRLDRRRASAVKRGGRARVLSLDRGDGVEPAGTGSPDALFLREWAAAVLEDALREMEAEYAQEGKETAFRIFCLRDVEAPPDQDLSYEALSDRFGVKVTEVTHILYLARKKLRALVLRRVRDTVTSTSEAEAEMIRLFGETPA